MDSEFVVVEVEWQSRKDQGANKMRICVDGLVVQAR
jgi:hypothetical protein